MKRLKPRSKVRRQYGVLPWRLDAGGEMEVLVITSRETRRWVIPKGWPIKGLSPGMAAAREAYEEAGVEGYASLAEIGAYRYDKRLKSGRLQAVEVGVYSLQVSEERAEWPEMHQREKRWVTQSHAAELVDEPGLKSLILRFPSGQAVSG
jgi:8-oxo-dGTP pyrophosphatase MutT (NUDIX family)